MASAIHIFRSIDPQYCAVSTHEFSKFYTYIVRIYSKTGKTSVHVLLHCHNILDFIDIVDDHKFTMNIHFSNVTS